MCVLFLLCFSRSTAQTDIRLSPISQKTRKMKMLIALVVVVCLFVLTEAFMIPTEPKESEDEC